MDYPTSWWCESFVYLENFHVKGSGRGLLLVSDECAVNAVHGGTTVHSKYP